MALKALRAFGTPTQYFHAGDPVDPATLDGPIPLSHWQATGFVENPLQPNTAAADAALAKARADLAAAEAADQAAHQIISTGA